MYVSWEHAIRSVPTGDRILPAWGPSINDAFAVASKKVTEVFKDKAEGWMSPEEGDEDLADDELEEDEVMDVLDTLDLADNYREYGTS